MSETLPAEENAIWIDTNDITFPGFIDLHNHPMYAMFEPWDAKQLFNNRYEWRSLDKYKQEISTPARNIQDDSQGYCDIAELAEVQAVTGGTTTFSDTFIPRSFGTTFPACLSRIAVRKLEIDSGFYAGHGHERVQNVLGVGRDLNDATAAEVRRKVAEKHLDLVLIHVAEGKRTDPESIKEFDLLKERGFLTHTTAVIHGVAFDKSDFGKMRLAATALMFRSRWRRIGRLREAKTCWLKSSMPPNLTRPLSTDSSRISSYSKWPPPSGTLAFRTPAVKKYGLIEEVQTIQAPLDIEPEVNTEDA